MSQIPPPMHVLPVDSIYPIQPKDRPIAITPVGVVSIVIAALSGVASFVAIIFSLVTFVAAQQQRLFTVANAQMYPVTAQAQNNYNPDALNTFQAQQALSGLKQARPLSLRQAQNVQTLLENHGKKIFPFDADAINPSRVKANVSESGEFLGSGGKMQVFYILGNGRLEAGDTQATYRSDDNTNVFRSNDLTNDQSLSEASIDRFITEANQQLAIKLNSAQEKTIRDLLRDPKQVLVTQNQNSALAMAAGNHPDNSGAVWIMTNNPVQIQLDAKGNPTLMNASAPTPGTNPLSGKTITTGWATALIGASILNGLLAILLLIAAILFLRGRPMGRKMHLWYGWLQLPLTLAAAVVLSMTINEWVAAQTSANQPPAAMPWAMGSITGLLGILWPIVILIVMTRKSVRDYFKGVM